MDLKRINHQLEDAHPQEILTWASTTFGAGLAATSSIQTQSVPLLHMISIVVPDLPVLFIDTGFHFPETLAFRDQLARDLGIHFVNLRPKADSDWFNRQPGERYHQDPDLCCYLNKVKPLQDAKKGLKAWITGIRRDQTAARADTPVISLDDDGLYKICPLVTWTRKDIWTYINDYQLPGHPLLAQGYLSIGCAPCTRPAIPGDDERSGRWAGQNKTECGLHISVNFDERKGNG